MGLKAAMWAHGTAMEVEHPGNLIPDGVLREGIGTHFYGHSGSFNWFHIAIPTPVILDGLRPSLVNVFLFYRLMGTGRIRNMHIWDGPFRPHRFDNLDLTGDHLAAIDAQNKWMLNPPLTIKYGLKLAIGVQFAQSLDVPDTINKLDFLISAAGADFQ